MGERYSTKEDCKTLHLISPAAPHRSWLLGIVKSKRYRIGVIVWWKMTLRYHATFHRILPYPGIQVLRGWTDDFLRTHGTAMEDDKVEDLLTCKSGFWGKLSRIGFGRWDLLKEDFFASSICQTRRGFPSRATFYYLNFRSRKGKVKSLSFEGRRTNPFHEKSSNPVSFKRNRTNGETLSRAQ